MAKENLSLDTIRDFDRPLAQAFDLAIEKAAVDCLDRKMDPRPRKITLTVDMHPIVDMNGSYEYTVTQLFVKGEIPTQRSRATNCVSTPDGHLLWEPLSPDNPDQETLPFQGEGRAV